MELSEVNTPHIVTELQFGQTVYKLEDEDAVRYNQGSQNAGKLLGIDVDGAVVPVAASNDIGLSIVNGMLCITYQEED